MNISRRDFLMMSSALALAGCDQLSNMTPANIVSTASTLVKGLIGAVKAVSSAYPSLIPADMLAQISSDLTLADAAADKLSTLMPATDGASTADTIIGYVNTVLNFLAGPPINGLIPAPFNMAFGAAAIVVPMIEAFVKQYISTPAAAKKYTSLRAAAPAMTQQQALATLAGYVK